MFTDMVGYSALAQENETLAHELLEEHRSILRPLFSKFGGREVKTTGDGFLIEFSSSLSAVNCAIEVQGHLQSHNLTVARERTLHIRIGIHLGEVEEREGDLYGDGVNIAARIEPLADAGGICISDSVYPQVKSKIKTSLKSIGSPQLKNIRTTIEVFKVILPWYQSQPATTPLDHASTLSEEMQKSIAVLPFENMSPDPEVEYFSDGITEELINVLAQIKGLRVPARTSAFMFKGKASDIREIGEQLDVKNILEGSVRKAENQVRITAQLIDVSNGYHLWSDSFDRELGDIFAVQEDIAQSIVDILKVHLDTNGSIETAERLHGNAEAYDAYLLGHYHSRKRTKEGLGLAIEYFEKAIAIQTDYALAFAGLADAYTHLAYYGYVPIEDAYSQARECALKALELDDSLAEAHASLAGIHEDVEKNYEVAELEFRLAIELNPNYAEAHWWYGNFLCRHSPRWDECMKAWQYFWNLDPLYSLPHQSQALNFMGKFDEALVKLEKAYELDPHVLGYHAFKGDVYFCKSDYDKAIEHYGASLKSSTRNSESA